MYSFLTTEKQKQNQSHLNCTRGLSRALSKLQRFGRKSDWFMALFAPVVIWRSSRPFPRSLSISFKASLSAKLLVMVIGYSFNFNRSLLTLRNVIARNRVVRKKTQWSLVCNNGLVGLTGFSCKKISGLLYEPQKMYGRTNGGEHAKFFRQRMATGSDLLFYLPCADTTTFTL